MKIYTRTGDSGQTSLFSGERVLKNHTRIEAYGSLDELNSCLGVAISQVHILKNQNNMTAFCEDLLKKLNRVQNSLFILGSHLATVGDEAKKKLPQINIGEITQFENEMDEMNKNLPALTNFILPGGGRVSSQLHFARTICRRAEREVIGIEPAGSIDSDVIKYINRFSDWLFVLARFTNQAEGYSDQIWAKP